jgi:predicted ATP-grasp superfamily ATP-dependent carboligase
MGQPVTRGAVFLTDGDQRSTLAVVRALGRAGISVTVGESRAESLAGSSRYCAARVRYPSPSEDSAGFQQFLCEEFKREEHRILIPMADVTTQLIAQMRGSIEPLVSVPIPAEEAIHRSRDKGYVIELAGELGIPCPRTVSLDNGGDPAELARTMHFPVVIKPRFSHSYRRGQWLSGPVEYACTPEELTLKCSQSDRQIPRPLLQEKLSGEGRGVFLLIWNGELKAAFCHRRMREKPPWGGVSVYRESIPLDEPLVEKSLALLKELDWQGVAMVEFKIDRQDGLAKLMEVNGRFWGSLQLAIDAGVNFPLLLYRLASGENVPPQFDYRVGVKSRWLLGDLDHLLITMKTSGHANGLPHPPCSRLKALARFLKFYERDLHYEILRMDDTGPGWFESKSYFREVLKDLSRARESSTC